MRSPFNILYAIVVLGSHPQNVNIARSEICSKFLQVIMFPTARMTARPTCEQYALTYIDMKKSTKPFLQT